MSNTAHSPDRHADALRQALQSGGQQAVVAYLQELPEGERLGAFSFAQGFFGPRAETAAPLDDYIAVMRAGIAEGLRRSAAAADAEQSKRLKDTANIFSFNLLADLAECWPDDTVERERRHFEEGLRAADDCIRWRDELGKPNDRKAMAWWGRGMHLLSLGRYDEAAEALRTACTLVLDGDDLAVAATSSFDQILYLGYYGLGLIATNDARGEEMLTRARAAFEGQLSEEEKREDAQFGLDQLSVVERKLRDRKPS